MPRKFDSAEEYNDHYRVYMLERYYKRKSAAIEKLGGKCVRCGSVESLEFDHIDPATKKYTMGRIFTSGSQKKVDEELTKCQLLCRDCHIEKGQENGDQRQVEHGGGISGKKNCKCDPCRTKRNEYMREWKRNNRKKTGLSSIS